jgi:hypothetical protein
LPSIGELHELLGFQYASRRDKNSFREATHAWLNSFKANRDLSEQLLRWKEPAVQQELKALAENFLSDGTNSELFWGAGRSWHCETDIRYPEDTQK